MQEINIQRRSSNINIDTATRNYHLPIASATTLGGIKVGTNLTIKADGTLNAESTEYQLPAATSSTLGGIKIGSGLSISDGIASVTVDSALDPDSANPVRNSIITSNINALTSAVQEAGSSITSLSGVVSNLSTTVSGHTSSLASIDSTLDEHTTAIQANTDNITTQASSISNNTYAIGQLDTRLTNAEGSITLLNDSVAALTDDDVITIQYTELSPASTWTAGNITIIKRGNVGFVYIDLEGSLTLTSGSSEVIYLFEDVIPLVKSSSVLLTDDASIIGEFDDYTYELSFNNINSQHSVTFTKVKGCIPIVFA